MRSRIHFVMAIACLSPACAFGQGSAYVPLDGWVYGALDRLASMGRVRAQFTGLKPWTRAECRRQLTEALAASEPSKDASELLAELQVELDSGDGIHLKSLFLRSDAGGFFAFARGEFQFIYYNGAYRSGNTDHGNLLGSPVGRDAPARQSRAQFLPGGSTVFDANVRRARVFQYERFLIPLIGGEHRNAGRWMRLSWEPRWNSTKQGTGNE